MKMKTLIANIICILLLISWQNSPAQTTIHKFILFAGAGNSTTSTAFQVRAIEPAYWIEKQHSIVGLRLESFNTPMVEACNSITLNYQYSITNKKLPFPINKLSVFFGVGVGTYVGRSEKLTVSNTTIGGIPGALHTYTANLDNGRVGLYPRVTITYNHIGITIDYNFVKKEHLVDSNFFYTQTGSQQWTSDYFRSQDYVAIKINYVFFRKFKGEK